MTERQWQEEYLPVPMLRFLRTRYRLVRTKVGRRKLRLVAAANCLTVADLYSDNADCTARVELAFRVADGLAQESELRSEAIALRDYGDGRENARQATWAAVNADALTAAILSGNYAAFARRYTTAGDPEFAERKALRAQVGLVRCIFGNPFRPVAGDPAWRTTSVVGLAETIYSALAFDRLPLLADALEEAGCDHPDVLAHCRLPGPHARGCWVVDRVIGK
jgi:hypothetical protein